MKKPFLLSLLGAIACAPALSLAQSPAPAASDTPAAASPAASPRDLKSLLYLTPEERTTLQEAGMKAQADPAVKAAGEKQHAAMKAAFDAMAVKDPSFGPLAQKIEAMSVPGAPRTPLSPEESQAFRAARLSIDGTPEADALQKAMVEYRATVSHAMVAADPAVAAILARMPSPGRPPAAPAPSPAAAASPQ